LRRLTTLEKRIAASNDEDLAGFFQNTYGYFGDDDSDAVELSSLGRETGTSRQGIAGRKAFYAVG